MRGFLVVCSRVKADDYGRDNDGDDASQTHDQRSTEQKDQIRSLLKMISRFLQTRSAVAVLAVVLVCDLVAVTSFVAKNLH